jgi:ubiquinone/menaquinone biosynthesis C-methylase UbiE
MDRAHQFDSCVEYAYPEGECRKAIDHYFEGKELDDRDILDAGCRTGQFTHTFAKLGAKPVGIDMAPLSIAEAKKRYSQLKESFFLGDITNLHLLPASRFDFIFCLGTLPYLNSDEKLMALKELSRVLKSDGEMIVVYQREKNILYILLTNLFKLFPTSIYNTVLVPILVTLTLPFSRILFGQTFDRNYLKYVFLSIPGLYFGYPTAEILSQTGLVARELATPNLLCVHHKHSISFSISKKR